MGGKYQPLKRHLESLHESTWRAGFAEVERILGSALPASARMHQAWWSNDASPGRHSRARLEAGWHTEAVNLVERTLTFRRASGRSQKRRESAIQHPYVPLAESADTRNVPRPWDGGNCIDGCLRLEWSPAGRVLLDRGGKLVFPTPPPQPGLYRFRVRATDSEERYVGEADDLRRRFQHYRTPGPTQATNLRLNAHLSEALRCGADAAVAIVVDSAWMQRGKIMERADLSSKAVRRLFESFVLVAENDIRIAGLNR